MRLYESRGHTTTTLFTVVYCARRLKLNQLCCSINTWPLFYGVQNSMIMWKFEEQFPLFLLCRPAAFFCVLESQLSSLRAQTVMNFRFFSSLDIPTPSVSVSGHSGIFFSKYSNILSGWDFIPCKIFMKFLLSLNLFLKFITGMHWKIPLCLLCHNMVLWKNSHSKNKHSSSRSSVLQRGKFSSVFRGWKNTAECWVLFCHSKIDEQDEKSRLDITSTHNMGNGLGENSQVWHK